MFSLVLTLLFLLCLSAFFSGSETALFSLSKIDVHRLASSGRRSAAKVVHYLKKPRQTLVTILFGNELVNLSISVVGAAIVSYGNEISVEEGTILSVALVTPLLLVFGEIIPKNISIQFSQSLAELVIWPLHFFYNLIRPLRYVLTLIADGFVKIFGGEKKSMLAEMIMEDEFKKMVDLGSREGVIVEEEKELINNVFEFTDKVVSNIMTPKGNILFIRTGSSIEKIIEDINSTHFSRMPLCEGESDSIVGILHVRDLLPALRKNCVDADFIKKVLREPLYVDEKTSLELLLKEFQRTRMHMALVNNAQQQLIGLVTMADVLEELFGEMEQGE